jgi:hypothetical protein
MGNERPRQPEDFEMANDEVLARGRLRTSAGLVGLKRVDCDVVVTRREVRISVGQRVDVLPLASLTGTRRQDFKMAPWEKPTTQLALEKATSNQFGPNLVLLLTHKKHAEEGRRVMDAIQRLVGVQADVADPSPATTTPDSTDLLRKLAELRDAGVLSDDEFAAKKQEILDRI